MKASEYISNATKEVKKNYTGSTKKSNIEKESVLKVAAFTTKSQKSAKESQKQEKRSFLGEDEVKKMQEEGSHVYRFDIQNNEIVGPYNYGPRLGPNAIASRLRRHKNMHKTMNKSVDGKLGSKRLKSTVFKHRKGHLNHSMLPDIKQQAQRRNISQIRRDEGEYSRILTNPSNNRLVQAQRTIDEALRKHRMQGPTKQQRNDMGKPVNDI
jgi:hypothetical protein